MSRAFHLKKEFPDIAEEIEALLKTEGELELASQLEDLHIVDRCRCGESQCATMYTVPRPDGPWGINHDGISLPFSNGMINIDTVGKKIVCLEVLDRNKVRNKLKKLMP